MQASYTALTSIVIPPCVREAWSGYFPLMRLPVGVEWEWGEVGVALLFDPVLCFGNALPLSFPHTGLNAVHSFQAPLSPCLSYDTWLCPDSSLCFPFSSEGSFVLPSLKLPRWLRTVKNPPSMQETQVPSLGWEDPLEKGIATYSSIRAWRTPWTEEPGRLQSFGLQRAGHDWATNISFLWSTSSPFSTPRLSPPPEPAWALPSPWIHQWVNPTLGLVIANILYLPLSILIVCTCELYM